MSPGLKRARQPFFLRNTITGLVLATFAAGVWTYSLTAVKQDDFVDVDEEARALARSRVDAAGSTGSETKAVEAIAPSANVEPIPIEPSAVAVTVIPSVQPRGVLASLIHDRYPRLLDPTTKTFVWGAPSVDNIGRIGQTLTSVRK